MILDIAIIVKYYYEYYLDIIDVFYLSYVEFWYWSLRVIVSIISPVTQHNKSQL